MSVRAARLDEIIALRHAVLRPGMAESAAAFAGDRDATTLHVGVFDADGTCLACGSAMLSDWEGEPAYQVRGMATAAARRGEGLGRAVLRFTEGWVARRTEVNVIWCNARVEAAAFYARHGWRLVSDVFEIPTVGPHYRMVREILDL